MKVIRFIIICIFIFSASCSNKSTPKNEKDHSDIKPVNKVKEILRCTKRGNTDQFPCPVSFINLIATPNQYSGMYVAVVGYLNANGSRYLFPTLESAISKDLSSSLIITDPKRQDLKKGYYLIIGKFEFSRDNFIGLPIERQAGFISVLDRYFFQACAPDDGKCITYRNKYMDIPLPEDAIIVE